MFTNLSNLFNKKIKSIEGEVKTKTKTNEVLSKFVKEEILKNSGLDCRLSYTFNKGIIKIETDNKIIDQEIALRIRIIEERLRREGVVFKKLLI